MMLLAVLMIASSISQVNIGGGSGYVFGSDFGYSRLE